MDSLSGGPRGGLLEEGSGVILATASYDHTIRFWNPLSAACVMTKQHTESQVNAMAITRDKGILGVAGYQHVRLHDLGAAAESAPPLLDYDGLSKNVTAIGFNADSHWMFTGGEDASARVWDLRVPHPPRGGASLTQGHNQLTCQRIFQVSTSVNSICLHPNQTELFVGDASGTIHLWDLRTDHNEQFVPEASASVTHVDLDEEGTILAAVNNKGTAYVWNLVGMRGSGEASTTSASSATATNTKPVPKIRVAVHKRYALKCRLSPDSTLLATTSADGSAKLWKTADFAESAVLRAERPGMKWVWDCAFTADSAHLFTASSDGVLRLWPLSSSDHRTHPAPLKTYQGHQLPITAMAFADARVA